MSLMERDFMGLAHHEDTVSDFGLAIAAALRRRYPIHTAKRIAQELSRFGPDCSVKTAENILAGHLSAKTITRLTLAHGLGLLIDAGAAVTGQSLREYIIEQADAARGEAARAEAREREHRSLVAGMRSPRTRVEVGMGRAP